MNTVRSLCALWALGASVPFFSCEACRLSVPQEKLPAVTQAAVKDTSPGTEETAAPGGSGDKAVDSDMNAGGDPGGATDQSDAKKTDPANEPENGSVVLPLDSETLPRLLARRGFDPGKDFKALVVVVAPRPSGQYAYVPFDFRKSSGEKGWWPASTVKIFAATAALEKIRKMEMSPAAKLTYHYPKRPVTRRLRRIVERAITPSDNFAFDQLVEFVGYDEINTEFLVEDNGLADTVLMRGYSGRHRRDDLRPGDNRWSPTITAEQEGRTVQLPERMGNVDYGCPNSGNCTTLRDLAENMRRVMMHEHLPEHERYDLGPAELKVLRAALAGERSRGLGVVNGIKEAFGERRIAIYHKPGYALKWFSDNVFVHLSGTRMRWIVAMANRPGRVALDRAARHVGKLIASGQLGAQAIKKIEESVARD